MNIPSQQELDAAFDERFPPSFHRAVAEARVAIAGLGGLGSNIAVMLTRCGVGHLLLVDFDRVDITNLNRQAYRIPHLGQYKTQALTDILREINPYLEVETRCIRVDERNAAQLFGSYPIVCEAFDQPENKAMLINTLLSQCPNTTIVSGSGMAGYADANTIQTAQVMRRLYVCGDRTTDIGDGIGLMAPRVAVCAGHQANQVIQCIAQQAERNKEL